MPSCTVRHDSRRLTMSMQTIALPTRERSFKHLQMRTFTQQQTLIGEVRIDASPIVWIVDGSWPDKRSSPVLSHCNLSPAVNCWNAQASLFDIGIVWTRAERSAARFRLPKKKCESRFNAVGSWAPSTEWRYCHLQSGHRSRLFKLHATVEHWSEVCFNGCRHDIARECILLKTFVKP